MKGMQTTEIFPDTPHMQTQYLPTSCCPPSKLFLLPSLILFHGSSLQIGILVRQARAQTFWEEDQLGAERKRAGVPARFAFVERSGSEVEGSKGEVKEFALLLSFYIYMLLQFLAGTCHPTR